MFHRGKAEQEMADRNGCVFDLCACIFVLQRVDPGSTRRRIAKRKHACASRKRGEEEALALKGYTNSEAETYRQKKLVRLTVLTGTAHVLLAALNVVLSFTQYGKAAFLGVVVYLVLFGIYVHGSGLLAELGHEKARLFKIFQFISVPVYLVTFVLALLS